MIQSESFVQFNHRLISLVSHSVKRKTRHTFTHERALELHHLQSSETKHANECGRIASDEGGSSAPARAASVRLRTAGKKKKLKKSQYRSLGLQ